MRSRSALGVGAAGIVLAAWLLVVVARHASQPVYDLPGFAVALGIGGAVASAAGWSLVLRRGDGLVLGTVLTALLLFGAVLTIFSIGILLLVAFAVAATAVARRASRRERPLDGSTALVAAVLIGIGLPAAALVAGSGPLVTCRGTGIESSSSIFRPGTGSSSGSVHGDATGFGGEGSVGDRSYRYRCEGGRLVDFEVRDR